MRILRRSTRRNTILASWARGRAVCVALEKMNASDRRKPLQVVEGKDQGLINQAVKQEVVLGGIDIGRLVAVSDHEMKRCGSDVTDRVLNRIPPPEVAMVSRGSRVVQAHGTKARGSLVSGAFAIAMQVLRGRGRTFGRGSISLGSLRHPDGQTGKRGTIFQKAPAAGIFRFHEFLLWNTFLSLNKGG